MRIPKVLLVERTPSLSQYSHLARRLTSWGTGCQFAISYKEVCALLGQQTFELVISGMRLVNGSALRMIPLLEGSSSSLFCFHPVQDSCLWIPIVEGGQVCWGAPVLHPGEFGRLLRRTLTEERTVSVSGARVAASPALPSPSSSQSLTEARQLAKAG
jgi:hypothetical protein